MRRFGDIAAAAIRSRRSGGAPIAKPDESTSTASGAQVPSRFSYTAFISYSHAADGKLAPAIQTALHRFARPWYRLRAIRVFRDEASLAANPALWSAIRAALEESEFFILLASQEAAGSKWVDQEVAYWFERRPLASLLIVLTDGELVWDDAAGDLDWAGTTALPPALRGRLTEEPRWVDLRWTRTAVDVSVRNPRFRDAIADIAAPLHRRPKDELIGEDVRQHRRTVLLARGAITALAVLMALAAAGAILAWWQRGNAIEQAKIARSRELAATAISQLPADPELSVLLAREAARLAPTPQAATALRLSLEDAHAVAVIPTTGRSVSDVDVSADERLVATGSQDLAARVWDWRSGKLVALLRAHRDPCPIPAGEGPPCTVTSPFVSVAFSPDGKRLATAGADGVIFVWDWRAPARPLRTLRPRAGPLADIAFSPDGRFLATITEGSFETAAGVWEWRTKRLVVSLPAAEDNGTSVAFGAEEGLLITTSIDGTARVWDWRRRLELATFRRPSQLLLDADLNPRAPSVAVIVADDGTATVWDWKRDLTLAQLRAPGGSFEAAEFNPDGRLVVTAGDDGIARIWDWATTPGTPVTELRGHRGALRSAAFTLGGSHVVSGGIDGTVRVWSRLERESMAELRAGAFLASAGFDPRGELVVGVGAGTTTVWRWRSQDQLAQLPASGSTGDIPPPEFAEFSHDGRLVAATSYDGRVPIWDWRQDKIVARLPGGTTGSFSSDGQLVVSIGNDGTARVWDWRRQKSVAVLPGPRRDLLRTAAFSPDNRLVVTVAVDGTVRVWEWDGVRRLVELDAGAAGQAAFSPDGELLVTSGNTPKVWDWARKRPLSSLRAPANTLSARFSPDGNLVVTAGVDNSIRVWDWRTEQAIFKVQLELPEPWQTSRSVLFSPNGRLFVTASDDGVARIYACEVCGTLDQLVALAEKRVTRHLTPEERQRYVD